MSYIDTAGAGLATMPTKTICILANSVKAKGYCIAGRVVEPMADKRWKLKKEWIRPISHRPKGELNDEESYLTTPRRNPRHFDIVEFDSDGRAAVIGQPEDFLITKGNRWCYLGKLSEDAIDGFLETPKNLWIDGVSRRDRATPAFIQAGGLPSLYLIKPESFYAHIDKTTWEGKVTAHRKAYFSYRGLLYDLPLTDRVFTDSYCPRPWTMEEGQIKGAPTEIKALCVSLSPPFSHSDDKPKFHYKLVAGVFV